MQNKRKPISVSVAVCAKKDIDGQEYEIMRTVVVCDDGSIWGKDYDENLYDKNYCGWKRMKDIPQD